MIKKNAKSSTVTRLKGGSIIDIPPQLSPEELIPTINDRLRRINQAATDTRAIAQASTGAAALAVQNNGALPASTEPGLNLIPGANVTIATVNNPDKKRTDVTISSAGAPGAAATVSVGSTTTGAAGTSASVANSGSSSAAVLDFTIPRGNTGAAGAAATVSVGSTTTGAAGTSASVANSGSSSAAVLDFTIPRGNTGATGAAGSAGAAATVSVGSTTTGAAGTSAAVANSGSSSAAVLDFTIPRGNTGATGAAGPNTIEIDKAASTIGTRGKLNFIQGANVTLTVADNGGTSAVDVTIAASGGGGGMPWLNLTDPSGLSMSWRNQGSASEAVANQTRYLLAPAVGGDQIRGREIAAPGSPFSITIGIVPQIYKQNHNNAGLYVSDGTKLMTFGWIADQVGFSLDSWSNATTYASTQFFSPIGFHPFVLFLRVAVSGGTMTWSWSVDGANFMQVYSAASTAYLASVANVGFFANSSNGTYPAGILLVSWKQL